MLQNAVFKASFVVNRSVKKRPCLLLTQENPSLLPLSFLVTCQKCHLV